MTNEYLEKQLEKWQRILLVFVGAAMMMCASTFGIVDSYSFSYGWVTVWVVLQLGTIPVGLLMLFNKDWRRLPLTQRLNTAFGFLGTGWLGWLALGFRLAGESSLAFAASLLPGAVLAFIYLLCRRARRASPEEIFP